MAQRSPPTRGSVAVSLPINQAAAETVRLVFPAVYTTVKTLGKDMHLQLSI